MPDSDYHPAEGWLNPLAALVQRWRAIDRVGFNDFQRVLCRELQSANLFDLIGWVVQGKHAPDFTQEGLVAGPRAVLRALDRVYDNPAHAEQPNPKQIKELQHLRKLAAQAAQDALDGRDSIPWSGDDWDGLRPQTQRLLVYMNGLERAKLELLFRSVWGREYAEDRNAVSTALCKANNFLVKVQWKRTLHKVRGRGEIRWT